MRHPRLNALTAEAVRAAAKRAKPEEVRKWAVVIDGQEFPVKQIVRDAANALALDAPPVTPVDFIAHDAVRILRRLGFEKEVKYYDR
jgi:hypothetical protein